MKSNFVFDRLYYFEKETQTLFKDADGFLYWLKPDGTLSLLCLHLDANVWDGFTCAVSPDYQRCHSAAHFECCQIFKGEERKIK